MARCARRGFQRTFTSLVLCEGLSEVAKSHNTELAYGFSSRIVFWSLSHVSPHSCPEGLERARI
eukprot:762472-Hanusia_phi.AAC.4